MHSNFECGKVIGSGFKGRTPPTSFHMPSCLRVLLVVALAGLLAELVWYGLIVGKKMWAPSLPSSSSNAVRERERSAIGLGAEAVRGKVGPAPIIPTTPEPLCSNGIVSSNGVSSKTWAKCSLHGAMPQGPAITEAGTADTSRQRIWGRLPLPSAASMPPFKHRTRKAWEKSWWPVKEGREHAVPKHYKGRVPWEPGSVMNVSLISR